MQSIDKRHFCGYNVIRMHNYRRQDTSTSAGNKKSRGEGKMQIREHMSADTRDKRRQH